jgi:hypothetical protein
LRMRDAHMSEDKGRDNAQKSLQALHGLVPNSDPVPPYDRPVPHASVVHARQAF